MPAALLPVTVEVGADFPLVWTYDQPNGAPVDLTGYHATFRLANKNAAPLLLVSDTDTPSYLVLGGVLGTITIGLPAAVTALLPGRPYAAAQDKTPTAHYTLTLKTPAGKVVFLTTGPVTLVLP